MVVFGIIVAGFAFLMRRKHAKKSWSRRGLNVLMSFGIMIIIAGTVPDPADSMTTTTAAAETAKPTAEPTKAPEPTKEPESAFKPSIESANGRQVLQQDVFAPTSKEFTDELNTYMRNGDADSVLNMVFEGTAVYLETGTEFTVIDRGFATHEIKVHSGTYAGFKVRIPMEYVGN